MAQFMFWSLILGLLWRPLCLQAKEQELWVAVDNSLQIGWEEQVQEVVVKGAKYTAAVSNVAMVNNKSVAFVTDVGEQGANIFKVTRDNSSHGQSQDVELVYSDSDVSYYDGIIYDDEANSILFTSPSQHSIFEQFFSNGSQITLVENEDKKPSGITQERCSRDIYWTNRDRALPSIERTIGHREHTYTLFSHNISLPRAITTDPWLNKLYWTDQIGLDFRLERSDLDGVNRELVCVIKHQSPYSLATDKNNLYWTDWSNLAIWKLPKAGGCVPQLVRAIKSARPNGLVVVTHDIYPPCVQTEWKPQQITNNTQENSNNANASKATLTTQSMSNSAEPSKASSTTASMSINPENYNNTEPSKATLTTESMSTPAPTGSPSPPMLCLNGGVYVAEFGCDCSEGYDGPHCEVFVCHNYCLNNASCFVVSEEPLCRCYNGTTGQRCQDITPPVRSSKSTDVVADSTLFYVVGGVGGLCVVLLLIVVALAVKLIQMKKQPRLVRKRFISGATNKNKRVTPPPANQDDGSGVYLEIENCCNMTMCDTPCFEPPSRAPKKCKSSKKEDKKKLLDASTDELF